MKWGSELLCENRVKGQLSKSVHERTGQQPKVDTQHSAGGRVWRELTQGKVCPNSSPVFKLLTGQMWQGALKWCSQCVLINGLREEEEGEREQWRWRKGCRSLLLPSHPNSLGDRTETVPSPKTSYSARASHSSTQ